MSKSYNVNCSTGSCTSGDTSCGCSASNGQVSGSGSVNPCCGSVLVTEQVHATCQKKPVDGWLFVENLIGFVMPSCGAKAELVVNNSAVLAIGARLYAPNVGFLDVERIKDSNIIVVKNPCESCDNLPSGVAPGGNVDAGTKWSVGVPSCGSGAGTSSSDYPYLASDFFIPAANACVRVGVTNTNGLASNQTVSIANNPFVINAIIDATTIEICNTNGAAGPIGTLIKAQTDCATYDYPIAVISSRNPCDQETPVERGSLVVCSEGEQTLLKGGTQTGFVKWDPATQDFAVQPIDLSNGTDCTTLTACFTLDPSIPAEDQDYLITVADSTIFSDPKYSLFDPLTIKIPGDQGTDYEILSIVDATHIRVKPKFTVSSIEVIGAEVGETVICVADCCELLQVELSGAVDTLVKGTLCNAPGTDNMIRTLTKVGQTLTIIGAPEHTSINYFEDVSTGPYPATFAGDIIDDVGSGNTLSPSEDMSVTVSAVNPSECREATHWLDIWLMLGLELQPGGEYSVRLYDITGGPAGVLIYDSPKISFPTISGGGGATIPFHMSTVYPRNIAAGATDTIKIEPRVHCHTASPSILDSVVTSWHMRASSLVVTK